MVSGAGGSADVVVPATTKRLASLPISILVGDCSVPATTDCMDQLPVSYLVRGASCADGPKLIAAGRPLLQRYGGQPYGARHRKESRARPGPPPGKNAGRNQASIPCYKPDLEPTSASPADQCGHNRDNPAPIIIEAGIHSSPGRQSRTLRTDKKIPNRNPVPDT